MSPRSKLMPRVRHKELAPQRLSITSLAWIFHKRVTNLVYDVSLLRRIASQCIAVLSRTGFSLCTVNGPQLKPHRLKPVLLDRDGPALSLLAVNPAGNLHRVHMRN